MLYYLRNVLPDGSIQIEQTNDVVKWGLWLEENRFVNQERVGRVFVSTIFLGLDHSYGDNGPLLYETMAFIGSKYDERMECFFRFDLLQDRCSTEDEARAMHFEACLKVMRRRGYSQSHWAKILRERAS